jgi:hypothetical protein
MSVIINFSFERGKRNRKIPIHMMIRVFQQGVLLFILLMGVGITSLLLSSLTFAQNSKPFELRSGVIVDPGRCLVYVMNPKAGIDALDIEKGTLVWSTNQAAKPLALAGNRLICQVETKSLGNELKIAILNVQEQGQRVITNSIKLPSNVRISINETLNTSFNTYGRIHEGELIVAWKYSYRPIKAIPPQDPERDKKEQSIPKSDMPKITSGIIRLDLSSGKMSSLREEDLRISLIPRGLNLVAQERLADIKGIQFIAADNAHVLTSQRVANDSVWDKYRWTIYERTTGEQIAEIKNHRSYTPFFIFNSMIIYETGPYIRRINKSLVKEPLKIRAFNFQNGEELWSWQIRDTKYRGPFPG